jgi:hypothetical protein
MADAYGDIAIAATGLKDPVEFDELIAGYSFGSGGRTFDEPGECDNGEYFACACGELYPTVCPREVQGEEDEEDHESDEDAFVSAVQQHLTDHGRVVISCFYREKFRYMGAEKLVITKTDSETEFLYANFTDVK